MSVTNTAIFPVGTLKGKTTKAWNVISTADTDVAGVISHGFGVAPALVWLVPLLSPQFYGKQWSILSVNTSVINLVAVSFTAGGLTSTPQLQVIAMLPHSLIG